MEKSKKFKNKYRIGTTRLKGFDYGSNGAYFVTICTKNRVCYFDIMDAYYCIPVKSDHVKSDHVESDHGVASDHGPILQRGTEIGKIAFQYWNDIPKHYPYVTLGAFVVMPNHVHGVLIFNNPDKIDFTPNQFGPQRNNLADVVRAYKSSVKRYANKNGIEFHWQSSYYESVIRSQKSFVAIRRYILNNPKKWMEKKKRLM